MRDILENNKMKIYVHEDHMEQGNIYMKHLSAMTKEQLHSKADIAGELAGRDIIITKLTKLLEDTIKIIDFPSDTDLLNSNQHELIDLSNKIKKFFDEQDLSIYEADSLEYNNEGHFGK